MTSRETPARAILTGWLAAFAAMVAPQFVGAETLKLRAGEHADFSRIVIDLETPSDWRLGRTPEGYELRLSRTGIEFDTSGVFRKIPRSRLADVKSGATPGTLALQVKCACHANVFTTTRGALVIDISDGPAVPGSRYETPLVTATSARPTVTSDQDERLPAGAVGDPSASNASLDPRLAFFWRNTVQEPQHNLGIGSESPRWQVGTNHPDAANQTSDATPNPGDAANALRPDLPDPRVKEAQADLLRQLSRAAAQGLIDVDTIQPAAIDRPTSTTRPPLLGQARLDGHNGDDTLAIRSETSIDRDAIRGEPGMQMTVDGGSCLADVEFDLGNWGDDRPAWVQIAEKRAPLVGEFDRPSPDAVLALSRLYLHLGFGAEALAVLTAFRSVVPDTAVLTEIGTILDGNRKGEPSWLAGMTSCDTAAALWALLSLSDAPPNTDINSAAVLRGFYALPSHLRRQLGPELSNRFLSAGAIEPAHAIRDAIARMPGDPGTSLRMIEAELNFTRGDSAAGEAVLDALALGKSADSPKALIRTIQSRLARGASVPQSLADSVDALAFEFRDSPDGPILQQMTILARASMGDFDRAFEAYRRWSDRASDPSQHDTAMRLFGMLTSVENDREFLRNYYAHRDILRSNAPDSNLRLELAERLSAAGFSREVRELLDRDGRFSDRGRRLLAAAALSDYQPEAALDFLEHLQGEQALQLRIRALTMNGKHDAASETLLRHGKLEAAGLEAWRAGNIRTASEYAGGSLGEALRLLRADRSDRIGTKAEVDAPSEAPAPGTLAEAQAMIETSRSVRDALKNVFAVTVESVE